MTKFNTKINHKKYNPIIAKFMNSCGFVKGGEPSLGIVDNCAQYHSSWDWLIPVWEYIKTLEDEEKLNLMRFEVGKQSIFLNVYYWKNKTWNDKIISHSCYEFDEGFECKNMMEVYYKTIVDFIQWYNEMKS